MATLQELLAQKAALDQQIQATQSKERGEAITKVKALMSEYGLTAADLAGKPAKAADGAPKAKVAAKYRNTETGETWTGRGLKPNWLKKAMEGGKTPADFAV